MPHFIYPISDCLLLLAITVLFSVTYIAIKSNIQCSTVSAAFNFLNSVYIETISNVKSYNKCSKNCISAQTYPRSFRHSFIAMIPCSKSAYRPLLFQVCQVATVIMEIMQLVLSQFKNCHRIRSQLNNDYRSKCCALVKLSHSGSVF